MKYYIDEDTLKDIADAIRVKRGYSHEIQVSDFAPEILAIRSSLVLDHIVFTKTKVQYVEGDTYTTNDYKVIAHFTNGTSQDVTSQATIDDTEVDMEEIGDYTVTASYSKGGVTKEASITITVAASIVPLSVGVARNHKIVKGTDLLNKNAVTVGSWSNVQSVYRYSDINMSYIPYGALKLLEGDRFNNGFAITDKVNKFTVTMEKAAEGNHYAVSAVVLDKDTIYVTEISVDENGDSTGNVLESCTFDLSSYVDTIDVKFCAFNVTLYRGSSRQAYNGSITVGYPTNDIPVTECFLEAMPSVEYYRLITGDTSEDSDYLDALKVRVYYNDLTYKDLIRTTGVLDADHYSIDMSSVDRNSTGKYEALVKYQNESKIVTTVMPVYVTSGYLSWGTPDDYVYSYSVKSTSKPGAVLMVGKYSYGSIFKDRTVTAEEGTIPIEGAADNKYAKCFKIEGFTSVTITPEFDSATPYQTKLEVMSYVPGNKATFRYAGAISESGTTVDLSGHEGEYLYMNLSRDNGRFMVCTAYKVEFA